jgi:hypothetical protein
VSLFLGYLQYPEMFVPLRQTLFLETARRHSDPNQGIGLVFHFIYQVLGQKLLDREHLVSQNIVMVENPTVGPKFRLLSTHSFM